MSRLKERYIFDWDRIFQKDAVHVEYSITDICNRSCRACSHLAPLAKHPNFVTADEFRRVTSILRRCIPDIHTFWLTGGEPTLHSDFMQLLKIAREVYPHAYVGIYSNGLTLSGYEANELFWNFMRDNGIVWGITIYENDRQYYEELFERHECRNNLAIVRGGNWGTSLTNYSRAQPIGKEKFEKCGWERCKINIRNGRIYNCPSSEFADLFNGYFGKFLTISPEDSLPVDETLTRERIEAFRNPIPFCEQCDLSRRHRMFFTNVPSKRCMEEWADIDSLLNR